MTTTLATLIDSLDPAFTMEIYLGTGGLCFFTNHLNAGRKFWLSPDDIDTVINCLEVYRQRESKSPKSSALKSQVVSTRSAP